MVSRAAGRNTTAHTRPRATPAPVASGPVGHVQGGQQHTAPARSVAPARVDAAAARGVAKGLLGWVCTAGRDGVRASWLRVEGMSVK